MEVDIKHNSFDKQFGILLYIISKGSNHVLMKHNRHGNEDLKCLPELTYLLTLCKST